MYYYEVTEKNGYLSLTDGVLYQKVGCPSACWTAIKTLPDLRHFQRRWGRLNSSGMLRRVDW